jgi:hypothetical protein
VSQANANTPGRPSNWRARRGWRCRLTAHCDLARDSGHDLPELPRFPFHAVAQNQRQHAGLARDLRCGLQRQLRRCDQNGRGVGEPRRARLWRLVLAALEMINYGFTGRNRRLEGQDISPVSQLFVEYARKVAKPPAKTELNVSSCEGFRMPAADGGAARMGGRRRKTYVATLKTYRQLDNLAIPVSKRKHI